MGLTTEQIRLIERIHLNFVRAGARFDSATQAKYNDIVEELAKLTTKFAQNVMQDETDITMSITADDLAGLPDDVIQAAKQAAVERTKKTDDTVVPSVLYCIFVFLSFVYPKHALNITINSYI